jgi:polyferredoxin
LAITTTRRISQLFFFMLFIWFCVVCSFGTKWHQLRGWPVNFFLQLDPLVAVGTLLSTHTLYKGLIGALATILLTLVFGRIFCGWVCPFGALHQFIGWLGNRNRKIKEKIAANLYRKAAVLKYFFLIAFLAGAAIPLGEKTMMLTGLLDPIPLFHRSVNMVLLPLGDRYFHLLSITPRVYEGAYVIGVICVVLLLLNLLIPRFFCRFICPTGALLGLIGTWAIFRIGKSNSLCSDCMACETACEGGCNPAGKIRIAECVSCFNCYDACKDAMIGYRIYTSESGEISRPDFSRRSLILSSISGILAVQFFPLDITCAGQTRPVLRPPGALPEEDFLNRCIRCGQCMRICPTDIIMPSGLLGGLENLWTPVLNFSEGGGGCGLTCTACGHVCPTAAIRPLLPEEKTGGGEFAGKGPVVIGYALVNRSRCLPWAFAAPCIVCQEVCPVTPKAIFIRNEFETLRFGDKTVLGIDVIGLRVSDPPMEPEQYGKGDCYVVRHDLNETIRCRIIGNTSNTLRISRSDLNRFKNGDSVEIQILLQQPVVDMRQCIGCGVCEHECPVEKPRAIRVYAGKV